MNLQVNKIFQRELHLLNKYEKWDKILDKLKNKDKKQNEKHLDDVKCFYKIKKNTKMFQNFIATINTTISNITKMIKKLKNF